MQSGRNSPPLHTETPKAAAASGHNRSAAHGAEDDALASQKAAATQLSHVIHSQAAERRTLTVRDAGDRGTQRAMRGLRGFSPPSLLP